VDSGQDLYAVLGVPRNASMDEIRRAYLALARRYHPDVSRDPAAAERFNEASEAHEVLADPASRARYDRLSAVARGVSAPAAGARRVPVRTGRRPPPDTVVEVELTVEEACTGGRREVTVRDRMHEVTFPAGAGEGQRIRVAGLGSAGSRSGPPGDLLLAVRLAPHPRFRVDGRDIVVDLPVSPWEAALGASVPVPTPTGPAHVQVPAGSSTGRRLRLRGRGLPSPNGPAGDLYAEVKVVVPDRLSDAERDLFQRLAERSTFDPRAEP
jgi:curved DNA-binding protein